MKIFFSQVNTNSEMIEEDLAPLDLKESIRKTRQALDIAYAGFDNAIESDLIDSYIYEINALQKRYPEIIHVRWCAIKLLEGDKEISEKYNNFLNLSDQIKERIEEKIYINFLEKAEATDNKTMRGIFEKSKKALICEEYEEILEEIENEKVLEEQESINTDEKILEEPKQTLEKFEEENPIGWEQKTFIIEPKTEVELEVEKIIKTMFPFLEDELLNSDDIDYIKSTLRRKKMYKELEIFDLFIENKQTTVVDPRNIYKDEKCLGLSEVGKDYIENYIKEHQLEHLLISEKTKKELKGSARENRLIKLYKNNFKIN